MSLTSTFDLLVALRLVRLIITPINDLPQYKAGIIDDKGNWLVDDNTISFEQRKLMTPLVRFAINLRRTISTMPGGKLLAFMTMVKSLKRMKVVGESQALTNLFENSEAIVMHLIKEEAPVTTTGNAQMPPTKKLTGMIRRPNLMGELVDVDEYIRSGR